MRFPIQQGKGETLMNIPSYQIHNVLNVYTRQLSENYGLSNSDAFGERQSTNKISLSMEDRCRAIVEKVATEIVDRVTRFGFQEDINQELLSHLQHNIRKDIAFNLPKETEFVFNVIDRHNEKRTQSLSVEDSRYLMKRLEELAMGAVDRQTESDGIGIK